MELSKDNIIGALREVYDPEIPINVYDLGLIYEIEIRNDNTVFILMTLTSPACPTADYIKSIITDAVKNVDGVEDVILELTFEPAWSPERISHDAKEELGLASSEEATDSALKNTFSHDKKETILCFNCGITDLEIPILNCTFKGEKTSLCVKCISKF